MLNATYKTNHIYNTREILSEGHLENRVKITLFLQAPDNLYNTNVYGVWSRTHKP
jgi:hypothetical protein